MLELQRRSGVESVLCVTGQHREMLAQALDSFGLTPAHNLDIMMQSQTLSAITAAAVQGLERAIADVEPHVVLVQGDTTTTLCGALAAFYRRTPVAQVEAGLRSGRKYSPFPEELNRKLTTQLTDVHFAPTTHARDALIAEGVEPARVHVTGNTVIDALLMTRDRVRRTPPPIPDRLRALPESGRMVLITGHRRESFGEGFRSLCAGIRDTAARFPDVTFVYPVHLNPNVRGPVDDILGSCDNVWLLEPLAYQPFVWLMDKATVVLTDSGGIQEEAPSLGKPVLVMRETTERPEGIAAGNAKLVGTRREVIAAELARLLTDDSARRAMSRAQNPYGDGKASARIADVLERVDLAGMRG